MLFVFAGAKPWSGLTEGSYLAARLLNKGRAALFSPGISIQTATTKTAGAAAPMEYL